MQYNDSKICLDIPIRCYQFYAYPLHSVFLCDDAYNWFFSNYINYKVITYNDIAIKSNNMDLKYIAPRYNEFPSLLMRNIHCNIFSQFLVQDIRDFIRYYINQGCTISIFVDEYYIPNRARYQKEHKAHQLLIIGYDFHNDQVKVIGYDALYLYSISCLAIDCLIEGFSCCPYVSQLSENITVYQIDDVNKSYDIDIGMFNKELNEFYNSTNSYCPEVALNYRRYKIDFGLQCYKTISEFFMDSQYSTRNHPMFYMICEHKDNMIKKLQYLQNKTGINLEKSIIEYQSIHILTKRILQYFLKRVYNSPGSEGFKKTSLHIVDLLNKIYDDEQKAISMVLEKLEG